MNVDLDALISALDDHSPDIEWVLDRRTGEAIPVTDPMVTGDEETQALVAANPDRYVPIEPIPSHEAFEIMEAFVATITPSSIHARLAESLRQRHPFSAFKTALSAFPDVRAQWFRFHKERMTFIAKRWLTEAGVSGGFRASDCPRSGV
jgi:hypothetical protein